MAYPYQSRVYRDRAMWKHGLTDNHTMPWGPTGALAMGCNSSSGAAAGDLPEAEQQRESDTLEHLSKCRLAAGEGSSAGVAAVW
mmetsp:Transcript_75392/g.245211  ORF Transcript_75392/g.245211 Transcript_75392/m.245211 type:complete len:84 (-) Transcript_75392:110-361(-)